MSDSNFLSTTSAGHESLKQNLSIDSALYEPDYAAKVRRIIQDGPYKRGKNRHRVAEKLIPNKNKEVLTKFVGNKEPLLKKDFKFSFSEKSSDVEMKKQRTDENREELLNKEIIEKMDLKVCLEKNNEKKDYFLNMDPPKYPSNIRSKKESRTEYSNVTYPENNRSKVSNYNERQVFNVDQKSEDNKDFQETGNQEEDNDDNDYCEDFSKQLLERIPLFVQLDVLCTFPERIYGWKQLSRWLKYEEKVDAGGRWSKPHVSIVPLRAFYQLRTSLGQGKMAVFLDLNSNETLDSLIERISNHFRLNDFQIGKLKTILEAPHKHMNRKIDTKNSGGECFFRQHITQRKASLAQSRRKSFVRREGKDLWGIYTAYPKGVNPDNLELYKPNKKLRDKLPIGSECASVLIGQVDYFHQPIIVFCRLGQIIKNNDFNEAGLPTKFLFLVLGKSLNLSLWEYCEQGRAAAMLFNDKIFCEVAYRAKTGQDILDGMDEFIDEVSILPPSIWDPTTRLDPPNITMTLEGINQRLMESRRTTAKIEIMEETEGTSNDQSLQRTKRFFGGLIQDVKRRYPLMKSDFVDGLNLQCLASAIFLYFACITPIITFGGIMALKTNGYMGTIEMLLAGALCGIIFALFSGQPLTIIGATGPLLVFEAIVYEICSKNDISFLSFRFWIGAWILLFMLIIVAFDLSYVVRYITRFTEECFAVLISVIFIYEAQSKIVDLWYKKPVLIGSYAQLAAEGCRCMPQQTNKTINVTHIQETVSNPINPNINDNQNINIINKTNSNSVEPNKINLDETLSPLTSAKLPRRYIRNHLNKANLEENNLNSLEGRNSNNNYLEEKNHKNIDFSRDNVDINSQHYSINNNNNNIYKNNNINNDNKSNVRDVFNDSQSFTSSSFTNSFIQNYIHERNDLNQLINNDIKPNYLFKENKNKASFDYLNDGINLEYEEKGKANSNFNNNSVSRAKYLNDRFIASNKNIVNNFLTKSDEYSNKMGGLLRIVSDSFLDKEINNVTNSISDLNFQSKTGLSDANSRFLFGYGQKTKLLENRCVLWDGSVTVDNKYCLTLNDCETIGGQEGWALDGLGCDNRIINSVSDVFFLSCLLLLGTSSLAIIFKSFKSTRYFPMQVRSLISDFAVFLAVFLWTLIDYLLGLDTPKLNVPETFITTRPDRGWLVNPIDLTFWWISIIALFPGILATILLFLDQQITTVIINRKEHKLVKGHGYHLDLLVLAILIGLCSLFGLPWFCAATVRSVSHVQSLVRESEVKAPGERPRMLGIREQRLTGLVIHFLIGLSVFGAIVLKFIPMPVLYGVFLYMGMSSLQGVQFVDRVLILFMPVKYQPDHIYLRHVETSRVHAFTLIQIICSAIMWIVKSVAYTSIAFPLTLLALMGVRKLMDYLFTQRDLYWLDHLLPDKHRKHREDLQKAMEMAARADHSRASKYVDKSIDLTSERSTSMGRNEEENWDRASQDLQKPKVVDI